ncbi:restriction endonuclease subunit S [Vibrio cholerae]|nr:restriction endonuclease subunit S [Vibrio cholerae]
MSSNWPTVTIQELIDDGVILVHKDGNHGSNYPRTAEFGEEGIPFLTAKLLDDSGNIDFDSAPRLSTDKANKFKFGFLEPNDVLLSHNATVGRVAVVPAIKERMLIGTSLTHYRLDSSRLLPKYLAAYFSGIAFQNQLASVMSQTTRNQVPITSQRKLSVVVPPIEDQKIIADMLGAFDDKIQNNTQTNQTLEQIAQAIFKSWFVDFDPVKAKIETLAAGGSADDAELAAMRVIAAKTLDELNSLKASNPEAFNKLAQTAALFPAAMQDSELGEIPEGWDNGTIEDVMQFSSERVDVSGLNLRNYISTENMLENKRGITTASSLPSVSSVPAFNENEILISNIRPYFKKIWLTEFKGGRSPDVLGFSLLDPEETEFAYNLLYQDRFFEYMMTTSKGAKMPRGDKSAIKQFSFPLPQKELRLVFSKHVRAFYPMIKNTNKESEHLHALRDALLPELLSGNLGRS